VMKLNLLALLKNVKNWVYEAGNAVADNEIKMYEHWFKKGEDNERK
jgi:hypothetical protein